MQQLPPKLAEQANLYDEQVNRKWNQGITSSSITDSYQNTKIMEIPEMILYYVASGSLDSSC